MHFYLPDEPFGSRRLAARPQQNVYPGAFHVFRSRARPTFGNTKRPTRIPRPNIRHEIPPGHLALRHG